MYTHSDLSLVLVFFILFALSALAFALALSPFFTNARVASFLGPLLFFLSSQLYNLFLDKGRLQQGNAPGKLAASLLPAMAFYIGASELSMYEGSEQGVSWATMWEGELTRTLIFTLTLAPTLTLTLTLTTDPNPNPNPNAYPTPHTLTPPRGVAGRLGHAHAGPRHSALRAARLVLRPGAPPGPNPDSNPAPSPSPRLAEDAPKEAHEEAPRRHHHR